MPDAERLPVFGRHPCRPHPNHLRPYCPKPYLDAYDDFVAQWGETYNELGRRAFSDEYRAGRRRNAGPPVTTTRTRMRDMDRDGVAGASSSRQP
jgi:hypothetical protein